MDSLGESSVIFVPPLAQWEEQSSYVGAWRQIEAEKSCDPSRFFSLTAFAAGVLATLCLFFVLLSLLGR